MEEHDTSMVEKLAADPVVMVLPMHKAKLEIVPDMTADNTHVVVLTTKAADGFFVKFMKTLRGYLANDSRE